MSKRYFVKIVTDPEIDPRASSHSVLTQTFS